VTPATGPELHDIHLPPAPSWWPPAPGWWILALIIIFCIIFAFVKLLRIQRKRRAKKAVLAELNRCIEQSRDDAACLAAALSQFLRRMALRDMPAAAAFTDERWLAYLDSRLAGDEFTHGVGRVLLDAPFRPSQAYDTRALIALVRRWTRHTLDTEVTHA
jgi:uncharacterized protein DUF4381